jgi:hypothetical protein
MVFRKMMKLIGDFGLNLSRAGGSDRGFDYEIIRGENSIT